VRLDDGATLRPKLVLAADGRDSALREAAGIAAKRTRFGQKALVFTVTHPIQHDGVSTEIHRSGGPFTLVPLPDHEGSNASAVVWMESGREASGSKWRSISDHVAFWGSSRSPAPAPFGRSSLNKPNA